MKAIGVVRKVDELGRIVIPVELRRNLGIEILDSAEFFIDGDAIVLKKYSPGCVFCGQAKDVINYKGKRICSKCKKGLGK